MNRVDPSYLPRSADKFSFDGPRRVQRITDYFVLVVLATVIATFGVTSNSDAMVIGAMIISPLMTPIMGATFNIVTGRPQHVWRSLVLAVVSIVVVVSLSLLLAKLVPNYQLSFANNAQITSRTSHNLSQPDRLTDCFGRVRRWGIQHCPQGDSRLSTRSRDCDLACATTIGCGHRADTRPVGRRTVSSISEPMVSNSASRISSLLSTYS